MSMRPQNPQLEVLCREDQKTGLILSPNPNHLNLLTYQFRLHILQILQDAYIFNLMHLQYIPIFHAQHSRGDKHLCFTALLRHAKELVRSTCAYLVILFSVHFMENKDFRCIMRQTRVLTRLHGFICGNVSSIRSYVVSVISMK